MNKTVLLSGIAFAALMSGSISMQQARADALMGDTPASRKEMIHTCLLECYSNLRRPEAESEYAIVLQLKPQDAVLHYNYGVFLQKANKIGPAIAQYRLATKCDPGNVDFHGVLGQMLMYNKDFNGAYNELGRAIQMPGGEKYKPQYENAVRYKQQADANRAAAATKKSAAPAKARPADDDDD